MESLVGVLGGGREIKNDMNSVISGLRREIDEIRALLGYYAAYCG